MINRLVNYLKASKEEIKKVTWPTKKEVQKYSILVITISLGVALFLGGLDKLFSWIFRMVA